MKCAILVKPTQRCLLELLRAIEKHLGEKELENLVLLTRFNNTEDQKIEAGSIAVAKYNGEYLKIRDWFTINERIEVQIISTLEIQETITQKYKDEIHETLSKLSNK